MTALISRAELDVYANQPLATTYPAEYLDLLIEAISENVESYCGSAFSQRDVVNEEVRPWWSVDELVFRLSSGPLLYLSGANWSWTIDHQTTALDLSTARIDYTYRYVFVPGIKIYPYASMTLTTLFNSSSMRLLVSYRAGYASVPSNVKFAVALLVREQIQSDASSARGRPGPLQSFRSGSYGESYQITRQDTSLGLGTEMTKRAKNFLKNYIGPGVAVVGGRP